VAVLMDSSWWAMGQDAKRSKLSGTGLVVPYLPTFERPSIFDFGARTLRRRSHLASDIHPPASVMNCTGGKAIALGCAAFLLKPLSAERLIEIL